jgi:two-component system, OmpR family, KDP operon response regulator KdpE
MSVMPKVLIASDSVSSGLLWNLRLLAKNITIITEPNLSQIVRRSLAENPDLIVLDLNLQDSKGMNLIHELREVQAVPLLILFSIQDADMVLKMYEAGADDCTDKTIEPVLFMAKINAWLQRSLAVPSETLDPLRVGKVLLIPLDRVARLANGCLIHLTSTETRLLYVLMSRAGHTILTEELISRVWREKDTVGNDVLKNMICHLREKLKAEPANLNCILTIPGVGYKFDLTLEQGAVKDGE